MSYRFGLGLLSLGLLAACSGNVKKNYKAAAERFTEEMGILMTRVDSSGKEQKEILSKALASKESNGCRYPGSKDLEKDTSLYVPKSAPRGARGSCFARASIDLTHKWKALYDPLELFSWLYVFDNHTKLFRTYPKTDTKALYGEDLNFDGFMFFKGALASFPEASWVGVSEDVSGTGPILSYSIAAQDPHHSGSVMVIGIDISTRLLRRHFDHRVKELQEVAKGKKFLHLYYRYWHEKASTLLQAGMSDSKWKQWGTQSAAFLGLKDRKLESFKAKEKLASQEAPQTVELNLDGTDYDCTLSRMPVVIDSWELNCLEAH